MANLIESRGRKERELLNIATLPAPLPLAEIFLCPCSLMLIADCSFLGVTISTNDWSSKIVVNEIYIFQPLGRTMTWLS